MTPTELARRDAYAVQVGVLERHRERCARCRKDRPCPEADSMRAGLKGLM